MALTDLASSMREEGVDVRNPLRYLRALLQIMHRTMGTPQQEEPAASYMECFMVAQAV
jgi:hypothetical protein